MRRGGVNDLKKKWKKKTTRQTNTIKEKNRQENQNYWWAPQSQKKSRKKTESESRMEVGGDRNEPWEVELIYPPVGRSISNGCEENAEEQKGINSQTQNVKGEWNSLILRSEK